MPLIQISALVHLEDYGQGTLCAQDYLDNGQVEVTVLDWQETLMVAIPQDTSKEPF
jgi:hypothetical protein|tara:strand:- start:380 stop:547 length:168 start_codon:yes stop_codon:yes gene_type:complete